MNLGINVCFAVKRLPEPEAWAEFVRADLGLDTVQFTFDLLDPWWPEAQRRALIRRVRIATDACGVAIGSASVGAAHYVPAGLLDPDPSARAIARRWWRRACDVAGELGATTVAGPLGTLSVRDAADPAARAERYRELLDSIAAITGYAVTAGVREFLIEPTPLTRGIPSTITECRRLLAGLRGRCPIPVGFTLDIGHAVFEPLPGSLAVAESWIDSLGTSIRMLHVSNRDRLGNQHWGWPQAQWHADLDPVVAGIRAAGLDDIPAILEVHPRCDGDDVTVMRELTASVAYCRRLLGGAAGGLAADQERHGGRLADGVVLRDVSARR
jgi:sugar phosphate isomerase/epimerase